MTAAVKDLYVEQGATFFLGFNWHREGPVVDGVVTPGTPYDITGCTARMQVRRRQLDPPIVTATSETPGGGAGVGAGRIMLGGETGRIEVTLTDEDTDLMDAKTSYYDLEIEWPLVDGELRPRVDRLLKGTVYVDPNMTQVDGDDPAVGP